MRRLASVAMVLACAAGAWGGEAPRRVPVGVAHGLAAFHWLDPVMLGALLPAPGFSTGKAYTVTGAWTMTAAPTSLTLTGVPTGTTSTTSTLVLNPASATSNANLIWAGVNGLERFAVDEDGDVTCNKVLAMRGYCALDNVGDYMTLLNSLPANGICLRGSDVGRSRVLMGCGGYSQFTLGAHLDQDDVLIKCDVDGDGGTYNVAGSNLHLWMDVTNAGTNTRNFLECSTDGATPLFKIDKAGSATAPTYTATTSVDCATNSAAFYPRRVAQAAIPTPAVGELLIWRDTDDGKVYLVYNDTDTGVKHVELGL